MISVDKNERNGHIVYHMCALIYLNEIGFIDNLFKSIMIDLKDENKAIQLSNEVIEYAIITNKIVIVDLFSKKKFDESNYLEFIELVNKNFGQFIDSNDTEFSFRYDVVYTITWKKELAKIGLWDRSVLNE